jgi:hypothetical protein
MEGLFTEGVCVCVCMLVCTGKGHAQGCVYLYLHLAAVCRVDRMEEGPKVEGPSQTMEA